MPNRCWPFTLPSRWALSATSPTAEHYPAEAARPRRARPWPRRGVPRAGLFFRCLHNLHTTGDGTLPYFQALVDYRTGFVLEAPDLDEARRMAQRIAINKVVADAVIDISQVEDPNFEPGQDPPDAAPSN